MHHEYLLGLLTDILEPLYQSLFIGMTAHSDSEIYRAFDISYEYDCYGAFRDYIYGGGTLKAYVEAVNRQEYIYPDNYVKLRFLENHDVPRGRFLIPDIENLKSWLAFTFFKKGMTLIYNGQEYALSHLPSLFDRDTIDRNSAEAVDLSSFIANLARIKRDPIFADSSFSVETPDENTLTAVHEKGERRAFGVFPLSGKACFVRLNAPDGVYENLVDGSSVEVFRGGISCCGKPVIIEY